MLKKEVSGSVALDGLNLLSAFNHDGPPPPAVWSCSDRLTVSPCVCPSAPPADALDVTVSRTPGSGSFSAGPWGGAPLLTGRAAVWEEAVLDVPPAAAGEQQQQQQQQLEEEVTLSREELHAALAARGLRLPAKMCALVSVLIRDNGESRQARHCQTKSRI